MKLFFFSVFHKYCTAITTAIKIVSPEFDTFLLVWSLDMHKKIYLSPRY